MSDGLNFFINAERAHAARNTNLCVENYCRSIRKILENEIIEALYPYTAEHPCPETIPKEILLAVWMNLTGYFRDSASRVNAASHPDAFELIKQFCINSGVRHSRFRTPRQKFMLKSMQIMANSTIGLLAWDQHDRVTAAKRYKEAIDLARTEPSLNSIRPGAKYLEKVIQDAVQQLKDNYEMLKATDARVQSIAMFAEMGTHERKSTLGVKNASVKPDWSGFDFHENIQLATDRCASCNKREAKLRKCSRCAVVNYCNNDCQKAHWKAHRLSCKPTSDSSDSKQTSSINEASPPLDEDLAKSLAEAYEEMIKLGMQP